MHIATVLLGARSYELGSYKRQGQVELAKDLALLLQAHFQHGPPPPLGMLGDDPTTIEELQERPEWVELTQCADLDAALAQLAGTELAEQLYYELFSVESEDEEEEGEEEPGPTHTQPAAAPALGSGSVQQEGSIEEGEVVGSGTAQALPVQQSPLAQQTPPRAIQVPLWLAGEHSFLKQISPEMAAAYQAMLMRAQQTPQAYALQQQQVALLEQQKRQPIAQQQAQQPQAALAAHQQQQQAAALLVQQQAQTPEQQQTAEPAAAKAAGPPSAAELKAAAEAVDSVLADAAAALAAMAGSPWEEEEEAEGEGEDWEDSGISSRNGSARKRRATRSPGGARQPAERRQRRYRAKLWCEDPQEPGRWALVLSQSALTSRNISLPWTTPGDMAVELLGAAWVDAARQQQQAGTIRKLAVLLDGDAGERDITYALYAPAGQQDTRPQYIEKLHPVLQRHSAGVGDVLLLKPLGPGRLRADLVKADTEEARRIHALLGYNAVGERQAWASKHQGTPRQLSRTNSLKPPPPPPPQQQQPGTARQTSPAATAVRREQEAAAEAVGEMMPAHKRPKWEHLEGSHTGTHPHAAAAAATAGGAGAASSPGRELHRRPPGLSALLKHPPASAPAPQQQRPEQPSGAAAAPAPQQQRPAQPSGAAAAPVPQQQRPAQPSGAAAAPAPQQLRPAQPSGAAAAPPPSMLHSQIQIAQGQLAWTKEYAARLPPNSQLHKQALAQISGLQQGLAMLLQQVEAAEKVGTGGQRPAGASQAAAVPPAAAQPRPAPASGTSAAAAVAPVASQPAAGAGQPPPAGPADTPWLAAMRQLMGHMQRQQAAVAAQAQQQLAPQQASSANKPAAPPAVAGPRPAAAPAARPLMVASVPTPPVTLPPRPPPRVPQPQPQQQPASQAQQPEARPSAQAAQALVTTRPMLITSTPVPPIVVKKAAPQRPTSQSLQQQQQQQVLVAAAAAAQQQQQGQPVAADQTAAVQRWLMHCAALASKAGATAPAAGGDGAAAPPPSPPVTGGSITGEGAAAAKASIGRPLLIRSMPVDAAPQPQQKHPALEQQRDGGRASPAVPLPPPGGGRPPSPAATGAARPPGEVVPDASTSLARMQAAVQAFSARVAVRVLPEQERQQRLAERLHVLATQLDSLLGKFWSSGSQPGAE